MCGILGAVGSPNEVREESLLRGLMHLAHRGPDDSGWHMVRRGGFQPLSVFLGNRRLAILDLSSAGHQPMHDRDSGNWIVFNGEIYNFPQIRAELQLHGFTFSSHSDTEVILKAYAKWGVECLHQLRGMFAFAIWDAQAQQLFLARDRFGEKPLYYVHRPDLFIFASEVRALLKTGLLTPQLNRRGLLEYLRYGSVSDPETLIDEVRSLPPAHYLLLRNGEAIFKKYWDLESLERNVEAPHAITNVGQETIAEFRHLLEGAISLRTVSDVPVGVFLSGGIDSSSIVALLSRHHNNLSTFSIVFEESSYSEAQYSRSISQRFGSHHHEIVVSSEEVLSSVPDIVSAMDQPTIDGVNTYVISREARRLGCKVALSGLGADEIFAGYSSFRTVPRMERFAWCASTIPLRLRRILASLIRLPNTKLRQWAEKFAVLVEGDGSLPHPYALSRMLFMPRQLHQLGAFEELLGSLEDAPLAGTAKWAQRFDPVNRTSYFELRHYMANTLLRDCDSMSMAHGLELRVPFVDHQLAEFLFRIPGALKLKPGVPKWLLIEAVPDLPQEVVRRPKRGFTFPFELWLRNEMRQETEDVLLDTGAELIPGVDRKSVAAIWRDFLAGKTTWSRPWSLFVLKRWYDTFLASQPAISRLDVPEIGKPQAMAGR